MIQETKPPTCLHILGQGLANQLHKEGHELFLLAKKCVANLNLDSSCGCSEDPCVMAQLETLIKSYENK